MDALDLRARPPRGPRETLDGLMLMPRTIDKIRATLPGGHLGPYHVTPGMSQALLAIIGVDLEALIAVVAEARSDEDVAAWLRSHVDVSRYATANAVLSGMRGDDVPAHHRARFEACYTPDLLQRYPINFDLMEADDRELYPALS
jgi:hypothetical protein